VVPQIHSGRLTPCLEERHKQFIKERQYVNNVSPATIRWYEQSLCWLDTESPTSDDIKVLIVRLRERGLEPVSIKSRLQAVRAYCRWAGLAVVIPKMKIEHRVLPTFDGTQVARLMQWRPRPTPQRTPLVEFPPAEKFLGPQSKGMGDVGSNGDLWRSLSGEFLKFWAEFFPDIDIKMLAAILCRKQRRAFNFVPRFLSSPISDWWNGNVVLSADFCQANVGHAKFLGECLHGSRPDFFVDLGASQANS